MKPCRIILRLLPLAFAAGVAQAQPTITQPTITQPGGAAFERRELERRDTIPRAQPRPAPATPALAEPPADAQRFRLNAVLIEGNQALPTTALEPAWRDLIGRDVTLLEMEQLTATLSAQYREAGFVLSQVILPAQRVEGGVVRLQAVEGFLANLDATGGTAHQQAITRRLLEPAVAERPLRITTLERGLLLSRDLLGPGVESVLRPSSGTFGAADLTAQITPRPFDGYVTIDNRNSRLLGPWSLRAGGTARGFLGGAERIDVNIAATPNFRDLLFGQAAITLPITGVAPWFDGSSVQLSADHTNARPVLRRSGVTVLNTIQSETNIRLGLTVPVIRSRPENLYARFSMNWRESTANTRFFGFDLGDATDRLLVAEGRLTWDVADRFDGLTLVDAAFRQGLAANGLSQIGVRGPGAARADFFLAQLFISRVQRFGETPWSVAVEGLFQYSPDPLPVSERFSLGGDRMGRGFGPGNTTGDSGYAGRLELRHTRRLPVREPFLGTAQFYGFGDWGAAIDRFRVRDGRPFEQLASVGAGARIDVTQWLTITPEVATQVAGRPSDTRRRERETRFLIGATARF